MQRINPRLTKHRSLSTIAIALAMVVLTLISNQVASAAILANPVQTYYVPLPEDDLFATFDTLNSVAAGNVNTVISVAIAADGTLVYYDHWEDGYDPVPNDTVNKQTSTEIWGDGDLTNGVAPGIPGDVLSGGDAIVLDNPIPPANNYRNPNTILYDGADRVQATLPIAVTRFAFPDTPGSLMAGAVEVFSHDSWGDRFIAPVGENTSSGTNAFEYSVFYVMAGDDNTELFLNGTSLGIINMGESFVVEDLQEGDELISSRPVQVDLVTGDIGDTYELRWYAQIDADEWSNEYITPVAEQLGSTGYWFYNPNDSTITISYEGGNSPSGSFDVPANNSTFIEVDSDGDISLPGNGYSGLRFSSTSDFYGLAQIDADGGGQIYDWGFPLIPTEQLTSQVLVGLGRGCTDDCLPLNNDNEESRSVVWVTPIEDSIIFIDFDGDGAFDDKVAVSALDSLRIVDDTSFFPNAEGDQDLTGAIIVSNTADSNNDLVPDGDLVDIAVVWGQDPPRSLSGDSEALDLGTVVVPLAVPFINKEATGLTNPDNTPDSDGIVDEAGDVINYIITISNVGFQDLTNVVLTDLLLQGANGTLTGPIESKNTDGILERGETWTYTGSYTVQASDVTNNGTLEPDDIDPGFIDNTATVDTDQSDPVSDTEQVPLELDPAIEIQKTVYAGHDSGASCPGGELVTGVNGAAVTYCFKVTNTGDTYLSDIAVSDPALGTPVGTIAGPLTPLASQTLFIETTITGALVNTATATGNPTDPNGVDLPGEDDVSDTDTAEVEVIPGTVSGHLYIDTNGNGTQDEGEPDLDNVDVIITDSAGNQQTVITDANGDWSATVPPGTTTADVDETDPDFPAGHTQTEGDDPTTVTAVSSQNTDAGIDGYAPAGTVSGHLYIDTNGNGTQDEGEPDLANVDVIITDSAGNQQTVPTDANGDWSATVPPGTTTADVDETDPDFPAGYTQTEGDDPTTVTAVSSQNTDAGIDGYTEVEGPLAVTLGYFHAERSGDGVRFVWQTVTETGTAGFYLYAEIDGNRVSLNDDLIPSPVIDSIEPTDYSFSVVTETTLFYLQEIRIDGGVTEHGPFELGMANGEQSGNQAEMMQKLWLPLVQR